MTVRTTPVIQPISMGTPEDVFLGCVSFEERCLNVAKHLSSDLSYRTSILFRYEGRDKGERRAENQTRLEETINKHCSAKARIILCDKSDPLDGMTQLSPLLGSISKSNPRITVDATAFTKQYLLVLLHELHRSIASFQLRITYTRGIFGGDLSNPPTWGVAGIRTVPYFNPILQDSTDRILIIILGFEPKRALAVFREVGAIKTIAVIPAPPSNPAGDLRCRLLHARILRDRSVEQMEASELDPDPMASILEGVAKKYPDSGLCVSPLGSKMQTVGIFKALMGTRDGNIRDRAQVIYAVPVTYNEEYYSIGFIPEPIECRYHVKSGVWTSGEVRPVIRGR